MIADKLLWTDFSCNLSFLNSIDFLHILIHSVACTGMRKMACVWRALLHAIFELIFLLLPSLKANVFVPLQPMSRGVFVGRPYYAFAVCLTLSFVKSHVYAS
jgi:hypothetical protein